MPKITKTDLKILKELQEDAWRSNDVVGAGAAKSASVVSRRIGELVRLKVITGAHAAIDPQKVGLTVTVFKLVTLRSHGDGMTHAFESLIEHVPNIVEWSRISGSWDYLVKLMTRNAAEHDALHAKLLAMPMVSRVRGMPVIGKTHVKPLPLDHDSDGGHWGTKR